MCTKWFNDGDVHKYFSPYATPYDAYIACMNVLQDLEQSLTVDASAGSLLAPVRGEGEMACVA